MANNRTEAKSAVDSALIPTLTLTQHIALLNNEINESTVFRKDVIASETPAGGNVTIDFSNKDTATITTAVNLAVSFTGMENGDVKCLSITKAATNTISFAGATDVSMRKAYINSLVTVVQYWVSNKNGVITVESINIDNDVSGNLLTKTVDIGDWDMDTDPYTSVPHGLSDFKKIKVISCTIRPDTDTAVVGLESANITTAAPRGAITSTDATNVNLFRFTGGGFDNTLYSATGFNRGYIVIEYLP